MSFAKTVLDVIAGVGSAVLVFPMIFGSGPGSMLHVLGYKPSLHTGATPTVNHHHHYGKIHNHHTTIYKTSTYKTSTYKISTYNTTHYPTITTTTPSTNQQSALLSTITSSPAPLTYSPPHTTYTTPHYYKTPHTYTTPRTYTYTTTYPYTTPHHYTTTHHYTTPHYYTTPQKQIHFPIVYYPTRKQIYGEEVMPASDDIICKNVVSKERDWCKNHKVICSVCSLRGLSFW